MDNTQIADIVNDTELLTAEADTQISSPMEQEHTASDGEQLPEDGTLTELETLRAEVERLRSELEQKNAEEERTREKLAQIEEFKQIFPNADLSALPDEVTQSVDRGNSLAAAYALYLQRQLAQQAKEQLVNQRNAYSSSGRIGGSAAEYFTPAEVRAMSQSEVRANYKKIRDSMKKWS